MEQLMIFTETNIYILSKLVALVRRETGSRHRLNSEESILSLLKESSAQKNDRIVGYFNRFLENLSPEQLIQFRDIGLHIPEQYMKKTSFLPPPTVRHYAYKSR